jgi:hypothetical protein
MTDVACGTMRTARATVVIVKMISSPRTTRSTMSAGVMPGSPLG